MVQCLGIFMFNTVILLSFQKAYEGGEINLLGYQLATLVSHKNKGNRIYILNSTQKISNYCWA